MCTYIYIYMYIYIYSGCRPPTICARSAVGLGYGLYRYLDCLDGIQDRQMVLQSCRSCETCRHVCPKMKGVPRPSSYPQLGPKYPFLRTIYPQLRVQGGSWSSFLPGIRESSSQGLPRHPPYFRTPPLPRHTSLLCWSGLKLYLCAF